MSAEAIFSPASLEMMRVIREERAAERTRIRKLALAEAAKLSRAEPVPNRRGWQLDQMAQALLDFAALLE